jgi:hypothetical protein
MTMGIWRPHPEPALPGAQSRGARLALGDVIEAESSPGIFRFDAAIEAESSLGIFRFDAAIEAHLSILNCIRRPPLNLQPESAA